MGCDSVERQDRTVKMKYLKKSLKILFSLAFESDQVGKHNYLMTDYFSH